MVTIYTERGPRIEAFHEERPFNFGRLALISLATALLLSLLASFNLNSDVKNLTTKKMSYVQDRLGAIRQIQR